MASKWSSRYPSLRNLGVIFSISKQTVLFAQNIHTLAHTWSAQPASKNCHCSLAQFFRVILPPLSRVFKKRLYRREKLFLISSAEEYMYNSQFLLIPHFFIWKRNMLYLTRAPHKFNHISRNVGFSNAFDSISVAVRMRRRQRRTAINFHISQFAMSTILWDNFWIYTCMHIIWALVIFYSAYRIFFFAKKNRWPSKKFFLYISWKIIKGDKWCLFLEHESMILTLNLVGVR